MKHKHQILHYFILLLCIGGLNAQATIEGYEILHEVHGGSVSSLQIDDEGNYYMIFKSGQDTITLLDSNQEIIMREGLDTILPEWNYGKLVKFNKDHEIISDLDIYTFFDLSGSFSFEHIRYDGGNIIIEIEARRYIDEQVDIYIGEDIVSYKHDDIEFGITGQLFVVVDAETLQYKNHVLVSADDDIGYQNWNVRDGFLYIRNVARNMIIVGQDTMTIDHPGYDRKWINFSKYDYINSNLEWSKMLVYGLSVSPNFVYPIHFGIEFDDEDNIYISGGDYNDATFFMGDTINQWIDGELVNPRDLDGLVMILTQDGEYLDYYNILGNAYVVRFEKIGEYGYILLQGKGQTMNYRGHEIDLNLPDPSYNANVIIKVDNHGNYIDHWNTNSDCGVRYNYMRESSSNDLVLFGQYIVPDQGCSNTTSEGIPFVSNYYLNGSLLTISTDLEVISNKLFSGDDMNTIPLDNFINQYSG